ncbi:MAG: InlB B-repeat-containing protein [Fibrobacterota bacterium]
MRPRLIIEYEGDVGAVFLDRSSDGEGSIASEPEKTIFTEGTEVVLRPRPDTGYAFSHWSGDLSGNDTVVTLTMDSNKSVTAHFEQAPQYTLTLSAENGKITATPDKDYYSAGEEVLLRAEPDSGYVFSEWNGDLAGNEYFIAHVSMDSHREIHAYFTEHNYYACPWTFYAVESVSSQDPDHPAENVLSDDPDEIWITQEGDETGHPHEIILEIDQPICGGGPPIGGLRYTPRQDSEMGRIYEYEVYHNNWLDDWGAPLDAGTWENTHGVQETAFKSFGSLGVGGRLRIVIRSEVNGGTMASAAYFEALMDTANTISIIERDRPEEPCVLYGTVLSIAEETPLRVRLSSVSGRQLKTISTVGAKEIDLGNLGLSPGIYILQVQDLAGNIHMHRTVYIR